LRDPSILRIAFIPDTAFEIVQMRYKKVQEVIAEIGGFINLVVIVIGFVAL
jgi:hypothetical protein